MLSERFAISRGTRQGCPLSPLLFALAIEPLAEVLRRSEEYQDIQVGNHTHKLSLFADDLILFVRNPSVSLQPIDSIMKEFQVVSGLSVNADKSLLYPIRIAQSEKELLQQQWNYKWVSDNWKYLGVRFPLDFSTFSKINLEFINSTVNQMLCAWTNKQLSWFERLQIVKSMILPKYLFLFRVAPLDITLPLLNKWQKTLLDFVWSYKKPRLHRNLLCAPKNRGGLALPDLKLYYSAAILSSFLKRYKTSYSAAWKDLMDNAFLPRSFRETIWQSPTERKGRYQPSALNTLIFHEWDKFRRWNLPKHTLLQAFLGQKWFLPGFEAPSFWAWKQANLTSLWDITK